MREIKYRGKRIDNGEWVYGNLLVDGNDAYIVGGVIEADGEYIAHEWWFKVDIETVGQYAGLNDKNDVDIYEGDVVKVWFWNENFKLERETAFIDFKNGSFILKLSDDQWEYLDGGVNLEVIGSKYHDDFEFFEQVAE